jgi:hypothetical protein
MGCFSINSGRILQKSIVLESQFHGLQRGVIGFFGKMLFYFYFLLRK